MTSVFALTTRGLETVSADEIAALPGVAVDQIAYRRVSATCAAPLTSLLGLRTVDDVFLDVATWPDVGRRRSALAVLGEASARLGLREAAATCAEIRPIRRPPLFSITVNFVGKRNYSTQEIKQVCAERIAERHRWAHTSDDAAADLNVRVFIEHDMAFVGVRLGERALHRRPYKRIHVPGSLKPPVAAALLSLVDMEPALCMLDPCCGAGTILIEAAMDAAVAQGGDSDPAAVKAAQTNADAAGVVAGVQCWDARALPVLDASVDRIVSNLPWGRQVDIGTSLASFCQRVCAEMRRVLAPGGRIALLTDMPHLVSFCDLECDRQIEISLFGKTPTAMIWRHSRTTE